MHTIKSLLPVFRALMIFFLSSLLVGVSIPHSGFAVDISDAQKNIYNSGIYYFDNEAAAQSCGQSTNLSGSDAEEKIFNFLVGKGLSPEQAAGIVGNFAVESGGKFDPFIQEIGQTPPNGGYGIAQWTGSRRTDLIKALRDVGFSVEMDNLTVNRSEDKEELLAAQLDFMWKEATGRGDIEKIKTETTVEGAVVSWLKNFEVAGIPNTDDRVKAGRDAMIKFGSGSSDTTTTSDAVVCGASQDNSGEVSGEFSLPVGKKWYTQHKEWFTKPHHDYPSADIPVPTGTSVFSMTAGKIIQAPVGGGCGNGVSIDAGQGVIYTYCHGSDGGSITGAKVGDTVQPGKLIMHSDNTGHSTGPHLHVQIKTAGQLRCPQNLLEAIGDGQTPPDPKTLPVNGCTN